MYIFTAVRKDIPKRMPQNPCDSLLSYFYRGFESRRVQAIAYRQRFGKALRGTEKLKRYAKACENVLQKREKRPLARGKFNFCGQK